MMNIHCFHDNKYKGLRKQDRKPPSRMFFGSDIKPEPKIIHPLIYQVFIS